MTITIMPVNGVNLVYDESPDLQNANATPSPAGDADDNDTALSLPSDFTDRLTALGANSLELKGAALSGYDGTNAGLDIFTVTGAPGGSIVDIGFTDSSGAPLNGLPSGLFTLDDIEIYLYTDTVNNNILVGREGGPAGDIVFAAYIEETATGGKIWGAYYEEIRHPDNTNHDDSVNLLNKVYIGAEQELDFSLAGAPSGQNLFLMFTTTDPTIELVDNVARITDPAIIVTGKDPLNQSEGGNINSKDTVNSSQAAGNITLGVNNQMVNPNQGLLFSFVTGALQDVTIPNLDQNEADIDPRSAIQGLQIKGMPCHTSDPVELGLSKLSPMG